MFPESCANVAVQFFVILSLKLLRVEKYNNFSYFLNIYFIVCNMKLNLYNFKILYINLMSINLIIF